MTIKSVLVTGSTGAIGDPLVRKWLREGAQVTVLVRNKHTVESLRKKFRGDVQVMYGDVTEPQCGVAESLVNTLVGNFDAVIHCAGLTAYHEHERAQTERANITGTENLLWLATRLQIPQFIYVSTAYVAGGRYFFGEHEISDSSDARNPYESSKIAAEALVRSYVGKSKIVRLSTVIGHSKTGEIVNAGGYAGFVKGFHTLGPRISPHKDHPFFVGVNPGSSLNLIPNEWAVDMLVCATRADATKTVHVTHTDPVAMGWLFRQTFGPDGLNLPLTCDRSESRKTAMFGDDAVSRDWRKTQEFISKRIVGYFGPYVTTDTTFGHEAIREIPGYAPPPPITDEVIAAQIRYMDKRLFVKKVAVAA